MKMFPRIPSFGCDEGVWRWCRETGMRRPDVEVLEKIRAPRHEMTGEGPARRGLRETDVGGL